jgi:hypothetical protein
MRYRSSNTVNIVSSQKPIKSELGGFDLFTVKSIPSLKIIGRGKGKGKRSGEGRK